MWLIGCEPVDGIVRYCRECGCMGRVRSSWRRRFVHMPVGQHAVHLLVRVSRYECMACARSWTDDLTRIADEGRRLTDAAVWWAVAEVVLKSKSVLACARDLHCSWGALNRAVLEKGRGRAGRRPAPAGRRGGDRRGRARVAAHPHGRPVRDRHRGPHPAQAWSAGPTARHGRGAEARRHSPNGSPSARSRSARR